ncbi:hypothetical protein VTG60DRAFT_5422 [Thermothelomyces hinnuleus]
MESTSLRCTRRGDLQSPSWLMEISTAKSGCQSSLSNQQSVSVAQDIYLIAHLATITTPLAQLNISCLDIVTPNPYRSPADRLLTAVSSQRAPPVVERQWHTLARQGRLANAVLLDTYSPPSMCSMLSVPTGAQQTTWIRPNIPKVREKKTTSHTSAVTESRRRWVCVLSTTTEGLLYVRKHHLSVLNHVQ